MITKLKTAVLFILLLCICLMGCKKSEPSIIGVWTLIKARSVLDSADIPIVDIENSYVLNDSSNTFTFYDDKTCIMTERPRYKPFTETYQIIGKTLVLGNMSKTTIDIDTIVTLTDHSLVLALKASSYYSIPHDSSSPIKTSYATTTYTR